MENSLIANKHGGKGKCESARPERSLETFDDMIDVVLGALMRSVR
jgi:hypothetical protein